VWLGRLPTGREFAAGKFSALFDITAELPAPNGIARYDACPCLDLTIPATETLLDAARRIEAMRGRGPVLVSCALGYSRSAAAVAAWLLLSGRAESVDAAIALLRRRRPQIALGPAWRSVLAEVGQLIEGSRNGR
jgi:protein-tyrosine phosphatase